MDYRLDAAKVAEVLKENKRKEMTKYFGTGFIIAGKDSAESFNQKCDTLIAKYEEKIKELQDKIANLNEAKSHAGEVGQVQRDSKINKLLEKLSQEEKEALKNRFLAH